MISLIAYRKWISPDRGSGRRTHAPDRENRQQEIGITSKRLSSGTERIAVVATTFLLVVGCTDSRQPVGVDSGTASLSTASADEFIVLLDPDHAPGPAPSNRGRAAAIAGEFGIAARHAYGTAVFGFSGAVPAGRVQALERDPRVLRVERVEEWELAVVSTAGGQELPTGVDRIEVDRSQPLGTGVTVDLDVAIIDGGIDRSHPDLNVAGGRNFVGGNPDNWGDGSGHGTHVAGTVAARDNGSPAVGVAPGARLWSVRVCRPNGTCQTDAILAAIDWVAERKAAFNQGIGGTDFAVANFSISSWDSTNDCGHPNNHAIHKAICGLVEQGVVFVLAAGNQSREKRPYPITFAASAIADFDGMAGGGGAATCRDGVDDTLADFSNFGDNVHIAAPGVCILSTTPNGGYGVKSGTSMSAPHVTGAVALYLHANGRPPARDRAGAEQIRAAIIDAALPQGTHKHPCSYDDDRSGGPLLFANANAFGGDGSCRLAGDPPPPDPATGTIEGAVTDADTGEGIENATVTIAGTSLSTTTDVDGSYSIATVPEGERSVTASAAGFESASSTVTVSGGETSTADFALRAEEPGDPNGAPVIEQFEVSSRTTGPWKRTDIEWTVSHEGGALASVTSELLEGAHVLESQTSQISGSLASGEHGLRTRSGGSSFTVRLTVRDASGNETSETRTDGF